MGLGASAESVGARGAGAHTVSGVTLHILLGSGDPQGKERRRNDLTGAFAPEQIEHLSGTTLSEDILAALANTGLFGPRCLVVEGAETITRAQLGEITRHLGDNMVILVSERDTLASAKGLPEDAIEHFGVGRGGQATALVRRWAGEYGVNLPGAVAVALGEVAQVDPTRARAILTMAQSGADVAGLVAESERGGPTPWAVADLIEGGRAHELAVVTRGLDLVGTAVYLSRRAGQLRVVGELGGGDESQIVATLGVSPGAARGLGRAWRTLGAHRAGIVIEGTQNVDAIAKTRGSALVRVGLVRVALDVAQAPSGRRSRVD